MRHRGFRFVKCDLGGGNLKSHMHALRDIRRPNDFLNIFALTPYSGMPFLTNRNLRKTLTLFWCVRYGREAYFDLKGPYNLFGKFDSIFEVARGTALRLDGATES